MKIPFLSAFGRDRLTILYLTSSRIVRADFRGRKRPELEQLWEAKSPAGASLAAQAEAAYQLGPASKVPVWVLNGMSWSQVLNVPASKVAGLEGVELANALSFEAEALSGISPFDSVMGTQPAPAAAGDKAFWITQFSAGELAMLEDALSVKGVQLLGVLHPGGVPHTFKSGDGTPQNRRVEVWSDVAFAVDLPQGGVPVVHPLGASGVRGDWRLEAEQWFSTQGGAGGFDVLMHEPMVGPMGVAEGGALTDEPVLKSWLGVWAIELAAVRPRCPIVRPSPRPMADQTRIAIGTALVAVTVALCVGHSYWLTSRTKNLQKELARAEAPQKRLESAKSKVTSLQSQLAALQQQADALRQLRKDWKESIFLERRRHAGLLSILAQSVPEEFAVSILSEEAGTLFLAGLSTRPDLESFATNLATGTEPLGWRYQPPRRRSLQFRDDGGPWLLDWSMTPVASHTNAAMAPPPDPKK